MSFRSLLDDFFDASPGDSGEDASTPAEPSVKTDVPQPTAAQVLYGGMNANAVARQEEDPAETYISDYDRNHLSKVVGEYEASRQANDPGRFREALAGGIGGTLQSYPHLRRQMPEEAVQAYRDFQRAFDDDEQRQFTANSLRSTPEDRAALAQAAAGKVLQALTNRSNRGWLPGLNAGPGTRAPTADRNWLPVLAAESGSASPPSQAGEEKAAPGPDGASGNRVPSGDSHQLSPSRDFVNPQRMLEALGFSDEGDGHGGVLLKNPLAALRAKLARWATDDDVNKQYSDDHNRHNDEADAFRHALWSYRVAKELGGETAKWLGDSHEREDPNPIDERLMDLFNNNVGRQLALDPQNRDRPDVEVIQEAIREGKLQLQSFRVYRPAEIPFDGRPMLR